MNVQKQMVQAIDVHLFADCRAREGGRQGRSLLDRRAWQLLPSGFLVLAPREAEPSAAAAAAEDREVEVPLVWLQVRLGPAPCRHRNWIQGHRK